jgi:hypothetical protein
MLEYQLCDSLKGLFSAPSLMKGEDPAAYEALYQQVEEVVQPRDVSDQMMVADVTEHFWQQQRLRRCAGTVTNASRRAALAQILLPIVNKVDAERFADAYFGVIRIREPRQPLQTAYTPTIRRVAPVGPRKDPPPASAPVPPEVPEMTREDVVALLKSHGLDESDIDRMAMYLSVDRLAGLENLAFKHELQRQAIFREVERRRKKRAKQQRQNGPERTNGKARPGRNLDDDQPDETAPH